MAADTFCSRCGLKATGSTADSSQNVLDMLRSGRIPSSATTPCISERVATLESRRQLLNSDIVRLEALILQMREEVASTDVEIARTKSLAAPIRSIPREILIHIFSLAREPSQNSLSMNCAPNKLGHVCRFWRTLSRSAPSLWANIDLEFAEYSVNSYAVDLLQQQLVLSNPCPLTIRLFLYGAEFSTYSTRVQTTTLLNVLEVHAPRWRSVEVRGPWVAMKPFFLMLSSGVSLPKLDTLTVVHSSFSLPADLDTFDLVLPSLRSFKTSIALDSFRAKWDSLTSFTGRFLGPASFDQFIHDASNLEFLKIICIEGVEEARTVDPCRQAIDHGHVRRLVLDPICALCPILDKVCFPALQELLLERSSHGHPYLPVPEDSEALLCRLVERSRCNLTMLSFKEPGTQLSNFQSILGMSTIVSLTINPGESLSNISACLQSLEITPSAPSLPGLRQLELMHDMGNSHLFTNESLQRMIMSRWNTSGNVARLSKLTLTDAYPERGDLDDEVVKKYTTSTLALFLLELQEAGLEVSWELDDIDVMKDAYEYRQSFL